MLKKFETRHVLGAMNYIGQTERKLRSEIEDMRKHANATLNFDYGGQRDNILSNLRNLNLAAKDFELIGLGAAVKDTQRVLNSDRDFAKLNVEDAIRVHTALLGLQSTAMHVLCDSAIYVFTRGSQDYVWGERVGFGQAVEDAFPASIYDSHEASKCMGLERWTAAVLHCMRALEEPLLAFAKRAGVKKPQDNWNALIEGIEAALKARPKKVVGDKTARDEAEAAAHFRYIKNAWRNYAMHGKDSYDEERATLIYSNTRALMNELAVLLRKRTRSRRTA